MKNSNLKNKIIELRKSGYSYDIIVKKLGCSKSTVSYHCGEGQKEKSKLRLIENRKKEHPLVRKIENFNRAYKKNQVKEKNTNRTLKRIIYQKIASFSRLKGKAYNYMNFSVEDLLKKIGKNPKCALTGRQIDLKNSKSYQLDHVVPACKGGENSLDNCQLVCREANYAKYDLSTEEFIKLCEEVVNYSKKKNSRTRIRT
jgi:5-methylcytosine-specific restriction endonuclease McrA